MKQGKYGAEDFKQDANVSRETLVSLRAYADCLLEWNARMNLVGRSTVKDLWHRHMLDSAQLWRHIPLGAKTLVDLGSGAGFPGLVLAVMGAHRSDFHVHLIESVGKKAAFLRAAAAAAGVSMTLHNTRIEKVDPFVADVVTARALAPLPKLIRYGQRFSGPNTLQIYLKGQDVGDELTAAHKIWKMKVGRQPSASDPRANVLSVSEVSSVQSGPIKSPSGPQG